MFHLKPWIPALLAMTLVGCSGVEPVKQIDPEALPKAVLRIEQITEEVLAKFRAGEPKEADGPMHEVGRTLATVTKLARPLGLDEAQTESLTTAVEMVLDGFAELHEPMHSKEFMADGSLPENFDLEKIATDLNAGLKKLREALPEEVLVKVDALRQP